MKVARKQELKRKPAPAAKGPAHEPGKVAWMPAVCIVLAIIAFSPVFKAEFLSWDDSDYVTNNQAIQTQGNLMKIMTQPVQGNYHPLTMLTLAINYAISGKDATSYHVLNLLLHLLNVLLVFLFVLKFTRQKRWAAFVTAVLFAVHPLHVESVAWIAERKDVLYSFFFLAGMLSYLYYLEKRSWTRFAGVLVLFFLSLLSKPSAIVFPLVLLALDYFYKRLTTPAAYVEKIPFLVLSVIFGLLALHGQSSTGAVLYSSMIPPHFKFFFGFYGIMMYLVKAIVPVNLCTFYPYPAINAALPLIYYAAPLVVLLLVALIFARFRKNRFVVFSSLFYLVNLALVLQFYPVGSAIIADRYSYMPLIGLFLPAGLFFQGWIDRNSGKSNGAGFALLIAVSLLLTVLTYYQSSTWRNDATLWDKAISAAQSSRAYTFRGMAYQKSGDNVRAVEMYSKAIAMNEAEKDALTNRGDLYFNEKKYDLAISDYSQILAVYPDIQQVIQNRGAAYTAAGKYDLALSDMNLALKMDPASPNGYANRALLEQALNRHLAAVDDFYKHMQISPDKTGDVWNTMGVSYLKLNLDSKALECFDKALDLTNNPVFVKNREVARSKLGRNRQQ